MSRKEVYTLIFFVFLILLTASLVSAGFFDWFQKTITGRAGNLPTNVSVVISGTAVANITLVSDITATTPIENNNKYITFVVTVHDPNGNADINTTSVSANFSKPGAITRSNESCQALSQTTTNTENFSCSIAMWYWDPNGAWNVSVKATDLGNLTWVYNSTTFFTLNILRAMAISPNALTWASLTPATKNQTSNNDPTIVNNTGNYNGTMQVTGVDLLGATDNTQMIPANNFTVSNSTSAGAAPVECGFGGPATVLVNNSAETITTSDSNPGNLSLNNGLGQETLYYCLPLVPSVPSQTYNSSGGSWTITYP